jgi:hypothetical protein
MATAESSQVGPAAALHKCLRRRIHCTHLPLRNCAALPSRCSCGRLTSQ